MLPDRWVVLGYRNGRVDLTAWSGARVSDPLPVGISPATGPTAADPFTQPGVVWMVDFQAAIDAGMGVRIPLTADQLATGFERVVVVGVKGFLADGKDAWQNGDGEQAAARLGRLLDAHHYTNGLSFVPQLTPTNNTGAGPSGYAPPDALDELVYQVERGPALVADGDDSDGRLVATALGLAPRAFAHVRHADGREQQDARTVNAALWPTIQSDFLEKIVAAPSAASVGEHFASFVRGRGPFPAIRVGDQPYGLLPVTSLERWTPAAGEDPQLAQLAPRLRTLWRSWQRIGERAPHAYRDEDVVRMLEQQPDACAYDVHGVGSVTRAGTLAGDGVVAPFAGRLGAVSARPATVRQALVAEALDTASYRLDAWATSLATRRLLGRSPAATSIHLGGYGWTEDVRQAGPSASRGYVQAPSVAQASAAAVLRSGFLAHQASGDGTALSIDLSSDRVHRARWVLDGVTAGQPLGALLGYRVERGLQEAGLAQYIARFRTLAVLADDPVLGAATETARQLEQRDHDRQAETAAAEQTSRAAEAQLAASQAMYVRVEADRNQHVARRTALTQWNDAVTAAQQTVAAIDVQITQHLAAKPHSTINKPGWEDPNPADDIVIPGSGTLAAWTQTLRTLRARRGQDEGTRVAAVAARDALAGVVSYDTALQAETNIVAALNGSLTAAANQRTADQQARDAAGIALRGTDGNGGAVRRERDAHDAWVASADRVRTLLLARWQQATESVAAHNVVDGRQLHARWRRGTDAPGGRWNATTIPWGDATIGLPALGTAEQQRLEGQLRTLDELVDAVADLLTAEGVYQLVQGNTTRAGTTLDAIASGQAAPPELEVVRTPRTGVAVTHRVLALMTPPAPGATPWGAAADNARAVAEPTLNAWVGREIVDPSLVTCRAAYVDPDTGVELLRCDQSLAALHLSPLDVLYLAGSASDAQQSELARRMTHRVLATRPATVPATAAVRLDFGRDPAWAPTVVSVDEFLEHVRRAHAFVTGTRSIDARDLALPGQGAPLGVDLAELKLRAERAGTALTAAADALTTAIGAANAAALELALLRIAGFGFPSAVPVRPATDAGALAALDAQARSVAQEMGRRVLQVAQHAGTTPGDTEAARREHAATRLTLVFGDGFTALPRIAVAAPAELAAAFDPARQLEGDEPLAATTWLQQTGRVREGVQRFWASRVGAEALAVDGTGRSLHVGQLPMVADERWVALPAVGKAGIPAGRLSLVAHAPDALEWGQGIAGLLVDEWTEFVPNRCEVTGVAFHFDQPNAQAPQSVLIAVAPDLRAVAWDLDTLEATLRETIELTRIRAAAPEGLTGALWHTARRSDGAWEAFTNVDAETGIPDAWQGIAAGVTVVGTSPLLHVAGTGARGGLWHATRATDGSWSGFGDVEGQIGERGTFREVACAGTGDTLHLCGISDRGLWHGARLADGRWTPAIDVAFAAGNRGVPQRLACAAIGTDLHLCLVTRNGHLWHAVRNAAGTWTAFGDVEGQAGDRGHVVNVACAAVDGSLHVVATTTQRGLWHTMRNPSGTWTTFGDIETQAQPRGYVEELACTGVGAECHLRTVTTDGRVWTTTRHADGSWTAFRETAGHGPARRLAAATAAGAAPSTLHLIDLAAAAPASTTLYFPSSALDLGALPA